MLRSGAIKGNLVKNVFDICENFCKNKEIFKKL